MNPFLVLSLVAFGLMLVQTTHGKRRDLDIIAIKSILTDSGLQNAMFQHPVTDGPTLYGLLNSSTFDQKMDLADRADKYGRPTVALAIVNLADDDITQQLLAIMKRHDELDRRIEKAAQDLAKISQGVHP